MSYNFANNQPSTFGFAPNVASLLSYVWIPVTSIIVLVTEKENRLVRFHAFQALFMGAAVFAATIILSVVIGVLTLLASAVSTAAGILISMISLVAWGIIALALLALWVFCLVKAYQGAMFKLPIVGDYAEKMINK